MHRFSISGRASLSILQGTHVMTASPPTPTPPHEPPYYAVIFTSRRTPVDDSYGETAAAMVTLAQQQPGFLGVDSARDPVSGLGITVSYWKDAAAITSWKRHAEHLVAQRLGLKQWYETFSVHVARVERSYAFERAGAVFEQDGSSCD